MSKPIFIDLFAGCGGISLGLINAGWEGFFAIEKTRDAFKTLEQNLILGKTVPNFKWPNWLKCEPMTTLQLLENYTDNLKDYKFKVDLIAGGPPCQGFSFAGKRNVDDPRNLLTEEYIKIVKIIMPKFIFLENVKGYKSEFKNSNNIDDRKKIYADIFKDKIEILGYKVFTKIVKASDFGVPQTRQRFILIGIRNDLKINKDIFKILEQLLPDFLFKKNLKFGKNTTTKQAISDLETSKNILVPWHENNNFNQIKYKNKKLTNYQNLMRQGIKNNISPNSLRLANHSEKTLEKFNKILSNYPKGKSLSKIELELLGTKKRSFTPLHPDQLSKTITTLPDDLLHYSEPRILTVRENARLQSFPDWFEFLGKYTTGGKLRKIEAPRYTQVGNAVPPLMSEAIGILIKKLIN